MDDIFSSLNEVDSKVRNGEISGGEWPLDGEAVLILCQTCESPNGEPQIEFRLADTKAPRNQRSWYVSIPQKGWHDFRKLQTTRQLYGCLLGPLGKLEVEGILLGDAFKELNAALEKQSIVVQYQSIKDQPYFDKKTGKTVEPKYAKMVRMDPVQTVAKVPVVRPEKKSKDSELDSIGARILGTDSEVPF